MSLLNTIKKVSQEKPQRFLAPIPSVDSVDLFSLQDGIPYWFNLKNPKSGWYWIEPISKNEARIMGQAQPHDYINYLNQLPKLLVIVLFSLDNNSSLVMQYNKNLEPKILHLTRNHLISKQPLNVLTARQAGDILLYDGIGYSSQSIELSSLARNSLYDEKPVPKLFEAAFNIVFEKIRKDTIKQKQLTTEDKIRSDLDFVGASLLKWDENEDGYVIEYEYEGAKFQIDLGQNRRVESAGICLAGTELDHNLSSVVLAMEQARKLHRFDLDRDLWI